MASKYYTKEAIKQYALLTAVKIVDIDNGEHKGWLVQEGKKYYLLPLDDIFTIYVYSRTHIKEIYHLTNNLLIPKEVLDNDR